MNRLKKFVFSALQYKCQPNGFFWGLISAILVSLSLFHVFFTSHEKMLTWFFFFFDSIGQTALEIICMICFFEIAKKLLSRSIYLLLVGILFMSILLQIFEFFLIRIMDVSLQDGIGIVFGADLNNFIELLYLSEVKIIFWIIIFVSIAVIPFLGIFLYRIGEIVAKKNEWNISIKSLISSALVVVFSLYFTEGSLKGHIQYDELILFKKNLPLKKTFLDLDHIALSIQKINDPQAIALTELENSSVKKPNIYLFIVESLRGDFLLKEYAPHLASFSDEAIKAQHSFSNANATMNSWFSIFYSEYPLHWSYASQKGMKQGAPALKFLKELGYKVHLYSSAQLKFYGFDKTIFGQDLKLCDTYNAFPHRGDKQAWESDQDAVGQLIHDLKKPSMNEGNLFLIFLDSTHFDYSWPPNFQIPFKKIADLTLTRKLCVDNESLEIVKNRYKNSIAYIDRLFNDFTESLKTLDLYNKGIIVFTGDHGEEFKEQGKLFHASNLNEVQTKVPLYYKFPSSAPSVKDLYITSHVDIFPSILHYLTEKDTFCSYVDGQSIFKKDRHPFVLSARYNSCYHPNEFFLHDGTHKIYCRFSNSSHIYRSKRIEILSHIESGENKKLNKEKILQQFSPILDQLFFIQGKDQSKR